MSPSKRIFDLLLALALSVILLPVILAIAIVQLALEGRPILYISERMRAPDRPFNLVKFRTMTVVERDSGVSGGDKSNRITPFGAFLRRHRLDELPQLWNVIRGDLSFVGPRPPLRIYVERFPEIYKEVLRSRPGITGLASLRYHAHEEWLLSRTSTPEETDAVYCRACIPRKARLDLIYREHRSLCFDLQIMLQTALPRKR